MFGIVWTYNEKEEEGYIIACDKQLYSFSKADYVNSSLPQECTMVDFRTDGKLAKEMNLVTSALFLNVRKRSNVL
jgi:hypothetical protein